MNTTITVHALMPETTRTLPEMSNEEQRQIDLSQQTQPSGKKVSIATLKRRQKELEEEKKKSEALEQRTKRQEKSQERKPLFARKQNATFFKQDAEDI